MSCDPRDPDYSPVRRLFRAALIGAVLLAGIWFRCGGGSIFLTDWLGW